ncbi:protein furry [Phthorimaea operculella]|nr:protein furry [Phthorimaea operculella]
MTGRMVSDILSRLVETVAEQGEDMQGYVTELLLTLEAAVDSLESNFRPLDYMRDIFKSTPNLNNKDGQQVNGSAYSGGKRSPGVCVGCVSNHTRSTSYSVSYCVRKNAPPSSVDKPQHGNEARPRPCSEAAKGICPNLCRSRSAQSLKLLGDSATQDDKLTILATLFWVGASLLESDYDHEFLLGVRLLARVMARLPLDRPDARERLDRTQAHTSPSLHALLLKGCTHPNTYEPVVGVLADMIPLLELPVIDPTQSLAFPMTVVALLPYMLLHYEDANELCVRAACHIAQVALLPYMIPLLELPVIDPTQSLAFPMTVVALLPYMLLHYEDANELCVRAACHIAQVALLPYMIPLLELPVIDPTQSLAFPMTVVALLPYMLLHYEDANELCVRAACLIAQVALLPYKIMIPLLELLPYMLLHYDNR